MRSKAVPTSLAPARPMGDALAPALRAEGSTDAKYLHVSGMRWPYARWWETHRSVFNMSTCQHVQHVHVHVHVVHVHVHACTACVQRKGTTLNNNTALHAYPRRGGDDFLTRLAQVEKAESEAGDEKSKNTAAPLDNIKSAIDGAGDFIANFLGMGGAGGGKEKKEPTKKAALYEGPEV